MLKERTMFHTQGFDIPYLIKPQKCVREDAWLGKGYYFWKEEQDAVFWGLTAKRWYGKYSVYECIINCENILDTVFNEEHYNF